MNNMDVGPLDGVGKGLAGARVLIVEDQAEVADLLVIAVVDAGGEVIAVASTMDSAMELISSEAISMAIVTKVVRGVHADVLARELVLRGIPYVVTAGTGATAGHPELHAAVTITKPFRKRYVQVVLAEITARDRSVSFQSPAGGALPGNAGPA